MNKSCEKVIISIKQATQYRLNQGLGINLHFNWQPEGCPTDSTPDITDKSAWDSIFKALDFINPSCIRFGYMANRFVDTNGLINKAADSFFILKRLDDWAVKHGASLCFDPWEIPRFYSIGDKDGDFYDAPLDLARFTRDFVIKLWQFLLHELKLETCKYFILMNEPLINDGGFRTPAGIDRYAYYVDLHKNMYEAFKANGLTVEMMGPNTWSVLYWAVDYFNERGLDLSPYISVYDQHNYYGRFDYLPPNKTINIPTMHNSDIVDHFVRKNARFAMMKGKQYAITEYGTFYYGWSSGDPYGPSTHEAFMTECEFLVKSIGVGCGGFYKWALLAPGEYQDGRWQFINTVDRTFRKEPHTFYGHSALMRYTRPGSVVFETIVEQRENPYKYVSTAALSLPNDEKTILITNTNNCEERLVSIKLPLGWQRNGYQKIIVDRVRKMSRFSDFTIDDENEFVLPPMSLTVLTTQKMPLDETLITDNNVNTRR